MIIPHLQKDSLCLNMSCKNPVLSTNELLISITFFVPFIFGTILYF